MIADRINTGSRQGLGGTNLIRNFMAECESPLHLILM
mgnify:CR=1 FL=1